MSRRREDKTARVVTPAEEQMYKRVRRPTSGVSNKDMECLAVVPFPGVVLQVARTTSSRWDVLDHTMVRGEIRTGTIELGPSVTMLAKEIRDCGIQFAGDHVERRKRVFALLQELEPKVKELNLTLHCSLKDLLIPLPRTFATTLANLRVDHQVRLRGQRSSPPPAHKAAAPAGVSVLPVKRNSFLCVHLSLTHFSVVLTTEPLASTVFTVMLDEHGSVDFIFKKCLFPQEKRLVNNEADSSIVLNVVRLKAECQTKLEVKSFETYLPEAELILSQRSGDVGMVKSMALNLPFNAEGSEPNVILRVQHLSQLFTVLELWTYSLKETLHSVTELIEQKRSNHRRQDAARTAALSEESRIANSPTDKHGNVISLFVVYTSYAYCYIDLGSGNSHQLIIGTGRLALERNVSVLGSVTQRVRGHVSNVSIQSEGVLSGSAKLSDVMLQGFIIENVEEYDEFRRSKEGRTFRLRGLVKKVHVTFKERQLKDIFECKITGLDVDAMDGIGEEEYTTTDLNVLLFRSTLGVTPSTVPALLTFVKGISFTVAEQKRSALDKLQEHKAVSTQQSKIAAELRDLVTRRTSESARISSSSSSPRAPFKMPTMSGSEPASPNMAVEAFSPTFLPFFGNQLTHPPCGQLRFMVENTTLLLGAISSGEAATGCVVASFPKARLSFAECPCDEYTAVKKVVIIETHDVELFRPGTYKVVIMGFKGDNYFELYTRQVLGSHEIGFTLGLKQTHPWTGNPRFKDFEEMISLMKSFTDKSTVAVFQKFGRVDANFTMPPPAAIVDPSRSGKRDGAPHEIQLDSQDVRVLKALKNVNFSPQLRFGGDVSVNTEVILNWIGVTEKMLPNILNSKLCDKLEKSLNSIADIASERTIQKEQLK
ncbi:hypothetical protein STCU_08784 [Strigomonas culicis]|uniref:Uncharacterized protein n=1 Tax=Strigomonas culicis TaxID=28005 RepID=S9TWB3_9TRYP|nr:hypothetical protein STCU_08784 [Strigomonas culicis]|eukprot:EPY20893.1 hypothetical protein STCU_08784 [Strigomonas culicis]